MSLSAPVGSPSGFVDRHLGPADGAGARLLDLVGYANREDLVSAAVPSRVRYGASLERPAAQRGPQVAAALRDLAGRNAVLASMIGLGYYGTHTPPVIRRN